MTTKTRKPSPSEKALAAAKERLVEAEKALELAREKNKPLIEAERARVAPIAQHHADLQKKLQTMESDALVAARVRTPPTDKTGWLGDYHPDLIAGVEKALGVSFKNRIEIRAENRRHSWSNGADPFMEAMKAVQDRVQKAFSEREDVIALRKEANKAHSAAMVAQGLVWDIEQNTRSFESAVWGIKREIEELQDKVNKAEDRRMEREWAKEAAKEAKEENLLDPAKARATVREIIAGTYNLVW